MQGKMNSSSSSADSPETATTHSSSVTANTSFSSELPSANFGQPRRRGRPRKNPEDYMTYANDNSDGRPSGPFLNSPLGFNYGSHMQQRNYYPPQIPQNPNVPNFGQFDLQFRSKDAWERSIDSQRQVSSRTESLGDINGWQLGGLGGNSPSVYNSNKDTELLRRPGHGNGFSETSLPDSRNQSGYRGSFMGGNYGQNLAHANPSIYNLPSMHMNPNLPRNYHMPQGAPMGYQGGYTYPFNPGNNYNSSHYNTVMGLNNRESGQSDYYQKNYRGSSRVQSNLPSVGRPSARKRVAVEQHSMISAQKISRRASAVAAIKKQRDSDEQELDEPADVIYEEDPIEKLLDVDENRYFVKFRKKSYIHCDWVDSSEISQTRGGLIKVKRFRKKEGTVLFPPEYIIVDRVLSIDNNQYFIKWKGRGHEFASWELKEDVNTCEGFDESLNAFFARLKFSKGNSAEWRPSREQYIRFEKSPVYKNNNVLREYQLEGLNWFLDRWYYKQGCIMADEMGLGKTVQSAVFINTLFTVHRISGPVIVVVPLTTMVHWEREFANWTELRVLSYHGTSVGREIIREFEFFYEGNLLFDVVLTTYEMVMSGLKHLVDINFAIGIFDEAHRLKNVSSKAATSLKEFSINHKVLLSGTPLQNNLSELWALLHFIDPMRFDSLPYFLQEYKLERSEDVERLQQLLRPLMLRRMKDDVEKSIPVKEETIVEVELTMAQKKFYRAILKKNIPFLTRSESGKAPNLLNIMMEIRKCCIHPYLIKGADEAIIAEYIQKKPLELQKDPLTNDEYYKILIQASGKLVLLDKLLMKLKGEHKVLIFSQMTKVLDLLADFLVYRNYGFERIDGGVRSDLRQAAIDRFSREDGDGFVFLLCTRAGGVGINLTAADTVVIFDSDWNPQNDLQAQARCHRIGQNKEVKIYRLVTRNTYEREMFDKAGLKLGLDRAVLQRMSYTAAKAEPKRDVIDFLLRKGAYGALMENDDANVKFCDEDIDQILQRRTKVVKHIESGNVFSKASFQVEEEIDEPDFWENLLLSRKTEENESRIRRQMRRLAKYKSLVGVEERITTLEATPVLSTRDRFILVFLVVLRKGIAGLNTLKGIDEPSVMLNELIAMALQKIEKGKTRDDYAMHIEGFFKVKKGLSEPLIKAFNEEFEEIKNDPMFVEYSEYFILRIQVVNILNVLMKQHHNNYSLIDRVRGFSADDDRRIIQYVLTNGYDNWTTSTGTSKGAFKGKSSDDLNQRLRKIVNMLCSAKNDEIIVDTTTNVRDVLLIFGEPTESNTESIVAHIKKKYELDDEGVSLFMDEVERLLDKIMSKMKKRGDLDNSLLRRTLMFKRIRELEIIPSSKKLSGLPRKWNAQSDLELKQNALVYGLTEITLSKAGMTLDLAVKRLEQFVEGEE